jgi:3-ketosteroid 9alpha-monooxygenase subunit A
VTAALRAVDPFCPHLGAHLGVNSDVVGNDLRCPYHHWQFNGEGGVTKIPYTDVIAPSMKRSCLPTWPVEEVDGVVYVWYHPAKAAPKWDVARIPECPKGEWVLAMTREWIVNIHCREIPEERAGPRAFRRGPRRALRAQGRDEGSTAGSATTRSRPR